MQGTAQTEPPVKPAPEARAAPRPPAGKARLTPPVESAPPIVPEMKNSLKYDIPAGVVVFLVALPLCLGIALASNAPAVSGIVAGIAGGIVIPLISRAQLSVSGPAAGLAAIVAVSIGKLGTFETFTLAVVLAGLMQILFGVVRGGALVQYVPSSVIKGMLAAIGILLILKQIPHAMGYDKEDVARISLGFSNTEEIAGAMSHAIAELEGGAVILAVVSMGILLLWEKNATLKELFWLPGPLVAVLVAVLGNYLFAKAAPALALGPTHLVALPEGGGPAGFFASLQTPNWGALARPDVWTVAVTVAIVATLETLLNVEAIDKLDPYHRQSPPNRELVAQGVGNAVSGLFGGLPVTSVVVRSTAGLSAGGRTRALAIFHGLLMLVAVLFAASLLNKLPLACLAGILLMTGYKLAKPAVFRAMYRLGSAQFIPFLVTVVGTVATDLLRGVALGVLTSIFFTVRRSLGHVLEVTEEKEHWTIRLLKEAPFYARAKVLDALSRIPAGARVVVDAERAEFVDHDVLDAIAMFERTAQQKNIEVIVRKRVA